MGKSSSMASLKLSTLKSCNSESKTTNEEYTPITDNKCVNLCRTQRKENTNRPVDLLDYNISSVLSKLKSISSCSSQKTLPKKKYARSCCSTIEGEKTESTSSFISYQKNKYSVSKQGNLNKSPVLIKSPTINREINVKENNFLNYLNSVQTPQVETAFNNVFELDKEIDNSSGNNVSDKET